MDKVFFFCVNFDRQSRGNSDVNCVDVGGVTIENLVTSGVQLDSEIQTSTLGSGQLLKR